MSKAFFAGAVVLVAIALAGTAQAALLFSEDFESVNSLADLTYDAGLGFGWYDIADPADILVNFPVVDGSKQLRFTAQSFVAREQYAAAAGFVLDYTPNTTSEFGMRRIEYTLDVNTNETVNWGWPWNGTVAIGEWTGDVPEAPLFESWVEGWPGGGANRFGAQTIRFTHYNDDPEATAGYRTWDMGNFPPTLPHGKTQVAWFVNGTPSATTYTGPDGAEYALDYDAYDVWVYRESDAYNPVGQSGWFKAISAFAEGDLNNGIGDMFFQYRTFSEDQVGSWIGFDNIKVWDELNPADECVLEADFDGNGAVDFGDFLALSQNWGASPATKAMGDADGNGTVDFGDFLALSQTWGDTCPTVVPEPATMSVLGLGALALIRRRR